MLYMNPDIYKPEIYKICYLKDNKINKIQVFNGNTEYGEQNILDLYESDKNIFDNIFNEVELINILENKIPIFFIPTFIYIDDTLETIKKKIIQQENISFEELYLFSTYKDKLNPFTIYEYLTQNKKLDLNKIRFLQFLSNINLSQDEIEKITDKETYTYNDVLDLKLNDRDIEINKALGQQISSDNNNPFPFLVNPYNIVAYDPVLIRSIDEFITTTNKSLLLSSFINQNKMSWR